MSNTDLNTDLYHCKTHAHFRGNYQPDWLCNECWSLYHRIQEISERVASPEYLSVMKGSDSSMAGRQLLTEVSPITSAENTLNEKSNVAP